MQTPTKPVLTAKDLRVGNYVSDLVSIYPVSAHDMAMRVDGFRDTYTPVELTRDILLKTGMVPIGDDMDLFMSKTEDGERYLAVSFDYDNGRKQAVILGGNSHANILLKADTYLYLHELQNLHFYLLGKELEINL